MKTGVFGGTFNPVHKGHIMLAEYCMDSVGLDRIIMIPTAVPPHKISKNLASENDRLNMCELACKGKKNFSVSDIEIKRQGKSYTYETVTQLKEIYPDDHLYTIMGADMFLTLDRWKNPKIIFEKSSIIDIIFYIELNNGEIQRVQPEKEEDGTTDTNGTFTQTKEFNIHKG